MEEALLEGLHAAGSEVRRACRDDPVDRREARARSTWLYPAGAAFGEGHAVIGGAAVSRPSPWRSVRARFPPVSGGECRGRC
jgi:hypothetical protein